MTPQAAEQATQWRKAIAGHELEQFIAELSQVLGRSHKERTYDPLQSLQSHIQHDGTEKNRVLSMFSLKRPPLEKVEGLKPKPIVADSPMRGSSSIAGPMDPADILEAPEDVWECPW